MTKTAVSRTGRTALAGLAALLCATLAACGTVRAGEAAGPAPAAKPSPEICDLDRTAGGGGGTGTATGKAAATATPDIPTEEQTGSSYAGPPTDQQTGPPDPPTDQETGAYAGPPTDRDTGPPDPPTDRDTGTPDPPTDHDTGTPGPPTDGSPAPSKRPGITNGAGPCGAAGWFDMTADFAAYFPAHSGKWADGMPPDAIGEVRVRKVRGACLAELSITSANVGKGQAEDARAFAGVFAAWRHEVYGDNGELTVRDFATSSVIVTESW
ncbi:hypothetical protein ACFXDJ_05130 [Streptomyces sp. NPDC059443]|uniref:hypothetical protein n=1 Tax=unclassified Streptomyces TaxID=2593676 RepID=UPI0036A641DB